MGILLDQLIEIYGYKGREAGFEHTIDLTAYLDQPLNILYQRISEESLKSYYLKFPSMVFVGEGAVFKLNKHQVNLKTTQNSFKK